MEIVFTPDSATVDAFQVSFRTVTLTILIMAGVLWYGIKTLPKPHKVAFTRFFWGIAVVWSLLVYVVYQNTYGNFTAFTLEPAEITFHYAGHFQKPKTVPLRKIETVLVGAASRSGYTCFISLYDTKGERFQSATLSAHLSNCRNIQQRIESARNAALLR